MANRPLSLAAGLSLGGIFYLMASCAFAEQANQSDWEARLAEAARLRAENAQKMQAADAVLNEAKAACQHKFQVNACVKAAEQEHLLVRRENRQRSIEADRIERSVKTEQRDLRKAEKNTRASARQAELPERAETQTQTAAQEAALREEKIQRKNTTSAERLQKNAEQNAAHQRKIADHEARLAKKKARAEAKAAKAEQQNKEANQAP